MPSKEKSSKKDKGAAKQGRKYLIIFEEDTGLFFVSCPARWRRKGKAALGLLSDADVDNDEKVDHMTFEECQAMVDKFSGAAELQGIDTTKKLDSHVQKPPPSIQAARDRAKEEEKARKDAAAKREKEKAKREKARKEAARKAKREEKRMREDHAAEQAQMEPPPKKFNPYLAHMKDDEEGEEHDEDEVY